VISSFEPTAVVAVIPNYNMGESLQRLLPQVLNQGYDRVVVLDDASTDASVEVVKDFGTAVEIVRSPVNQGAGANRNQIIDHVDDRTLIHFIDADMDLVTDGIAEVARKVFSQYADRGVGVIGGLVSRSDGSQEPFNFGPVFSLKTVMLSWPPALDRIRHKPKVVAALRRIGVPGRKLWPDIFTSPEPRETYWLHEGNMLVHSAVFRAVGGYDPDLRYHDAQDLAIRLEKRGVKRQFDPEIEVIHHYIDVRGKNRGPEKRKAVTDLIRKHGVGHFLTGR
jgi:GT2 family glycosyltransferase